MTEQEHRIVMTSVQMLSLKQFDQNEVLGLYNALMLYGRVAKENYGYQKAVDFKLIDENGIAFDIDNLKLACAHIIQEMI